MEVNRLPHYDDSVNTTGCCPRFDPEGWDGQELHFRDKRFLRAETRSAMHVPLDMGVVFARVQDRIAGADAYDADDFIVMSRDLSAWKAEHLFAVSRDVAGEEMTKLSGDYLTKVFEGPYREARAWEGELRQAARDLGGSPGPVYFFYTTCPKCAKAYGRNYVVGVVQV